MSFSSYDLNEFVYAESGGSPIPSVAVDYGFFNCKNAQEKADLKEVYRKFFDSGGHPFELHEAAIAGKTLEHVSKFVQLEDKAKYRRLMKNPYPLEEY